MELKPEGTVDFVDEQETDAPSLPSKMRALSDFEMVEILVVCLLVLNNMPTMIHCGKCEITCA